MEKGNETEEKVTEKNGRGGGSRQELLKES
jgi:hypothetical protein